MGAGSNNTITNEGSIATSGILSPGIFALKNNTITNSGFIVAQVRPFNFGLNNTLNLNAPSFIGGGFGLSDNTTLNITTGPSHSILWTFGPTQLAGGAPNIAGSVPVFQRAVSATELQVATFDPIAFAAAFDVLAQSTGPQSWFSLFGSIGDVDARSATLGYDLSNGVLPVVLT